MWLQIQLLHPVRATLNPPPPFKNHKLNKIRFLVTATTQTPSPSPSPITSTNALDNKWIAGPVVGSVAAVALLLSLLYFFRLRRRKPSEEEAPHEKAQLDGEGLKPKELHDNEIRELQGDHMEPSEMDAGYTGAELGAEMSAGVHNSGDTGVPQPPDKKIP